MKRIFDLTEQELCELSEEQIARYIDYECALAGVPMLPPKPGPEPSKDFPEKDVTCYLIAGVVTRDSEHASRILAAIASGEVLETTYTGSDYNNKRVKPLVESDYNYPKITTERHHSPEQWDAIKDSHSQFAMRKEEWTRLNEAYKRAIDERAETTKSVYDAINDARRRQFDREQLRAEFSRYMELSENNRQIALNFLEKVKDLSEFPELQEEFLKED